MACQVMACPLLPYVEMGGRFQSPYMTFGTAHIWGTMRAASPNAMGLGEDNNCPSFLAGYSALSWLVPSIKSLLLVASSSIWFKARQLILSKSPRYAKFDVQMIELLLGGGYYGYGFSLKSIPRLGHASSLVNNQVVHRFLSLASYSTVIRA
jgi:hypothetical protein